DLGDRLGELTWPAARVSAEDRHQRFSLAFVRALVDVDAHRGPRALPEIALEGSQRNDVQIVQSCVAEVPLTDVPREDSLAVTLARRLRKRARTGDGALAHIEPIALYAPCRYVNHRFSFPHELSRPAEYQRVERNPHLTRCLRARERC